MSQAGQLLVPVSTGELVDKITILRIKQRKIKRPEALKNISTELDSLQEILTNSTKDFSEKLRTKNAELRRSLEYINQKLWDVEDSLRAHEADKSFGEDFIDLARSVYHLNDKRALLKREINILCRSKLIEEKSYAGNAATIQISTTNAANSKEDRSTP